ncbi:hypothetical protein GS438_07780 [Rhodococcus hoagii]|nr:hypothetical protein [Prescottella equi]
MDIGALPDLERRHRSEQSGVRFGRSPATRPSRPTRPRPACNRCSAAHPARRAPDDSHRGTTVGSIVHADPSAEMPAVGALLGGTVTARSVGAPARSPRRNCFVGPLESALEPDEIATSVTVPPVRPGVGNAIDEIARRHGDYAPSGWPRRSASRACRHVGPHDVRVRGELGDVVDYTDVLAARPRATPGSAVAGAVREGARDDRDRGRHPRHGRVPLAAGCRPDRTCRVLPRRRTRRVSA